MGRIWDVATASAGSALRMASGTWVGAPGERPQKPLELYEFEACPYCRRVREALSILDLDAIVYPCPKGGQRYRPAVSQRGGKAQFPYLADPNTGIEMYESAEIVGYLFSRYGTGPPPLSLGGLAVATGSLASLLRPASGVRRRPSAAPGRPLELYSFEASPYCRLVREVLCELELPYRLHNVARGSAKRDAFEKLAGRVMVPYLVDPNTGTSMFESADIIDYLDATYAR